MSSFIEAAAAFLPSQIEEANALATKLLNANNSVGLLHEYRDSEETTDEKILAYRAYVEQADNAILAAQAKIEEYILSAGFIDTEPVDVASVTQQYKDSAKLVTDSIKFLSNLPEAATTIEKLPPLLKVNGSRSTATGKPINRPRVIEITLDGEEVFNVDKDGKKIVTMSVLALHLSKITKVKVEGTALREAMFAAAKTTDLSSLNGTPIDFSFSVADKNYAVHVVPAV